MPYVFKVDEIETVKHRSNTLCRELSDEEYPSSKAVANNVASCITVTLAGNPITVDDVSPLPHVCSCQVSGKPYKDVEGSPNIYNFTQEGALSMYRLGSMFPGSEEYLTYDKKENGSYVINGYNSVEYAGEDAFPIEDPLLLRAVILSDYLKEGQTYTFCVVDSYGDRVELDLYECFSFDDEYVAYKINYDSTNRCATFTHTSDVKFYGFNTPAIFAHETSPYVNYAVCPQLEMKTTATEWIPDVTKSVYKTTDINLSRVEVLVNENPYQSNDGGNIDNIGSAYPTMNVSTTNPNVNIEFTYNADTKKYIDNSIAKLRQEILGET